MTYKRQKLTKREFLHQQYEKGRTKPQAEATWRMIRAVDGWPRRDGPKSPITRDQFIYKQRRKGRSYRQGAGTWKMMKGAKHWLSQYKLNPGGKRIVVTYEIYSYEDLEAGEAGGYFAAFRELSLRQIASTFSLLLGTPARRFPYFSEH